LSVWFLVKSHNFFLKLVVLWILATIPVDVCMSLGKRILLLLLGLVLLELSNVQEMRN